MKRTITVIIAILLALAPPAAALYAASSVRGVYANTFTAELKDKYDLLTSETSPKIVVIGGSSVCFGLDSELLSRKLSVPVVDFGLYATLGTGVMMDLSRNAVKEGDIVIIAPEIDPQTFSDYSNGEALLEAADGNYYILGDYILGNLASGKTGELAGSFVSYVSKALGFKRSGISPDPSGIYRRSSFNSRGDIAVERKENVMTLGYDPNRPVEITPDVVDDRFVDIVNDYTDYLYSKGARVFFSFGPVNGSALSGNTSGETVYGFYSKLRDNLHAPVISDVNDYILDQKYFYDTNFHLNDAGTRLRTKLLCEDILRALGDNRVVSIEIFEPSPGGDGPGRDDHPVSDGVFLYEPFGDGIMVTGLTGEALGAEKLVIPVSAEGVRVTAIGSGAFGNAPCLKTLVLGGEVSFIADGAFDAPGLEEVFIDSHSPDDIEAGDDLFGGSKGRVTLYLPDRDAYESFVSGYWWSEYQEYMKIGTPER